MTKHLSDVSPEALWKMPHVDKTEDRPYPVTATTVKVAGKQPGPAHKKAELSID